MFNIYCTVRMRFYTCESYFVEICLVWMRFWFSWLWVMGFFTVTPLPLHCGFLCRPWRFVAVFTGFHPEQVDSTHHALNLGGIVFSSDLCLSLQNVLFLQVLWANICVSVSFLVWPAHIPLDFIALIMFGEEWHLWCCSVFSSLCPSVWSSSSIPGTI